MTATEEQLRGRRAVWHLAEPIPAALRAEVGDLSPMVCHLLYCRGLRTPEQIRAFLLGSPISHDPFLLPDMEAAVERIRQAVAAHEHVAVYGDFDCDGLTSAAVLALTLRGLGLEPTVYIPERVDGHGLSADSITGLAGEGVSLIVTADCGVTALEEVQVARALGIDVVITDHHEPRADGNLPDCPTVNPIRHDSEYPCRFLCGVGVSFKLAQALSARLAGAPDPDDLLDLVALGTVADVVPLRDENRTLVIRGLQRLAQTRRPGLRALFEVASVDPRRVDPTSVGYYLAPRINAANRMASPQVAYELIAATDAGRAEEIAAQLNTLNHQRQALVAQVLAELTARLGDADVLAAEVAAGSRPPILFVVGSWPPGISGLLAGKLVDRYGLPAFAGAEGENGVVSVSGRGVPGVHLDELLEASENAVPGLFLAYGGHSRAGGFRVEAERLELARCMLEQEAQRQIALDVLGPALAIDAELRLDRLTWEAAQLIRGLAPFGMDFDEPVFLTRGVLVKSARPMGVNHARFTFERDGVRREGVCFNAPDVLSELRPGVCADLAYAFEFNEWQGRTRLQLRVKDWRLAA